MQFKTSLPALSTVFTKVALAVIEVVEFPVSALLLLRAGPDMSQRRVWSAALAAVALASACYNWQLLPDRDER